MWIRRGYRPDVYVRHRHRPVDGLRGISGQMAVALERLVDPRRLTVETMAVLTFVRTMQLTVKPRNAMLYNRILRLIFFIIYYLFFSKKKKQYTIPNYVLSIVSLAVFVL